MKDFHSLEMERRVLGGMMLDLSAADYAIGLMSEKDFHSEEYAKIFSAVRNIRAEGKTPDWFMVAESVGEAAVMPITQMIVSAADIESVVSVVLDYSQRRALLRVLGAQFSAAQNEDVSIHEIQNDTEAKISAVGESRGESNGPVHIREALKSAAETWSEIVKGETRGVLCGLKAVDSIIQGFRPGKLIVLAARPGVGKSALALQIARQINRPVLIQSLEMLAEENAERLVSQLTEGVDSYALRDAEQLIRHKASLSLAVSEISRLPIFISDRATKTPQQMMSDARRIKRNHGLDLMIVDYLQLCESSERESNRSLEVGKVSKYLKRIANDLEITVIAVSSLSRKCEDREDKRPIKSDLRESGDIEHDADAILMLYRESDYNKAAEDDPRIKPVTEFIWRKNRGGRIGRELATYDGPRLRFYDMVQDSESAYRGFMKNKEPGNVW